MDMLRALAAPNMDIRKKTLDLALGLIDQRNIDEARPCQTCESGSNSMICDCIAAFATLIEQASR